MLRHKAGGIHLFGCIVFLFAVFVVGVVFENVDQVNSVRDCGVSHRGLSIVSF
jgi:hypothetical protein